MLKHKQCFSIFSRESHIYYVHFLFLEKEVIRKKYKKSQKQYLADYNLLVAKDLWQAHDQVLLIISLKEVIKLNVNTDTMKANVKLVVLNTKIASVSLNTQIK